MSKPPALLNLAAAAERLGVNRRTLHRWLIEGRCPVAPIEGSKPPKWRRIDLDALDGGE